MEQSPLQDSALTLKNAYVAAPYLTATYNEPQEDVETYLRQWLDEPGQRQLALLGGYGQGKSTAGLMFSYHLLWAEDHIPNRIPILIELRGTSPRNLTPLSLLGAWASQYNINPQALLRLHIGGRLVLLFLMFRLSAWRD